MKSIKKRIILAVTAIITTAVFLSCKKEEKISIVGKWNATKEIYTSYKNGAILENDTFLYDPSYKLLIEFAPNGTGAFFDIEKGIIGTNNFTYKTEGNKLIFYIENDTLNSTFALTSNTFTWHQSGVEEFGGDKYTWDDKTFFTRQ